MMIWSRFDDLSLLSATRIVVFPPKPSVVLLGSSSNPTKRVLLGVKALSILYLSVYFSTVVSFAKTDVPWATEYPPPYTASPILMFMSFHVRGDAGLEIHFSKQSFFTNSVVSPCLPIIDSYTACEMISPAMSLMSCLIVSEARSERIAPVSVLPSWSIYLLFLSLRSKR